MVTNNFGSFFDNGGKPTKLKFRNGKSKKR